MEPPEIFDRRLRRLRRDRAAPGFARADFLRTHMIEELLDRLDGVTRNFADALDLGCADGALGAAFRARGLRVVSTDSGARFAAAASGIQCDEDRLPFGDGVFDLVVSAGALDSVNDLPGALALIRRSLKPDGLFLAALVGSGSLAALKSALLTADLELGRPAQARVHPQIDVRSAGDLLMRAGFALPVADAAGVTVRYPDILALIADLRAMGLTNLLPSTRTPIGRAVLAAARAFADMADADGRVSERFEILYLTGWAPGPDQPVPARRGSASVSLADALQTRKS